MQCCHFFAQLVSLTQVSRLSAWWERKTTVYSLLPTTNEDVEHVGWVGEIMRSGATPVVEQSWTRKLQHCITQNQSIWLRSFSLANTAPTGFKAELKMNGSNVTYRSRQRFTLVNHHFSHLERFWPIFDKIGLAGQIKQFRQDKFFFGWNWSSGTNSRSEFTSVITSFMLIS